MHGKKCWKANKKYPVLTEGNTTVTVGDDDDGVYLTTACYTMEDWRKGFEDMS
jgi:hypothetical protein